MTTRKPASKPRGKVAAAPKRRPRAGANGSAREAKHTADRAVSGAADKVAQEAKDAGAVGRVTGTKRRLRDAMIVARATQQWTLDEIAAEAKVTQRTVARVLADARSVRSSLDASPMDLLDGLVTAFGESIATYHAMAHDVYEKNPSVALGALKAADHTRERLYTVLANVGKLPSDLETFRTEEELRRLADEMAETLMRVRDGHISFDDAIAFLRSAAKSAERPALNA